MSNPEVKRLHNQLKAYAPFRKPSDAFSLSLVGDDVHFIYDSKKFIINRECSAVEFYDQRTKKYKILRPDDVVFINLQKEAAAMFARTVEEKKARRRQVIPKLQSTPVPQRSAILKPMVITAVTPTAPSPLMQAIMRQNLLQIELLTTENDSFEAKVIKAIAEMGEVRSVSLFAKRLLKVAYQAVELNKAVGLEATENDYQDNYLVLKSLFGPNEHRRHNKNLCAEIFGIITKAHDLATKCGATNTIDLQHIKELNKALSVPRAEVTSDDVDFAMRHKRSRAKSILSAKLCAVRSVEVRDDYRRGAESPAHSVSSVDSAPVSWSAQDSWSVPGSSVVI